MPDGVGALGFLPSPTPGVTNAVVTPPLTMSLSQPAGISENEFLQNQNKPIYETTWQGIIFPTVLDPARELSIEATRERVYGKK